MSKPKPGKEALDKFVRAESPTTAEREAAACFLEQNPEECERLSSFLTDQFTPDPMNWLTGDPATAAIFRPGPDRYWIVAPKSGATIGHRLAASESLPVVLQRVQDRNDQPKVAVEATLVRAPDGSILLAVADTVAATALGALHYLYLTSFETGTEVVEERLIVPGASTSPDGRESEESVSRMDYALAAADTASARGADCLAAARDFGDIARMELTEDRSGQFVTEVVYSRRPAHEHDVIGDECVVAEVEYTDTEGVRRDKRRLLTFVWNRNRYASAHWPLGIGRDDLGDPGLGLRLRSIAAAELPLMLNLPQPAAALEGLFVSHPALPVRLDRSSRLRWSLAPSLASMAQALFDDRLGWILVGGDES